MMKTFILVLTLAAFDPSRAAFVGRKAFLGNGMQPEVVARTLSHVEDEWRAQAAVYADCDSASSGSSSIVNCADAPSSFGQSCDTVVKAIVQGSGGDKNVAKEYMDDVCSQRAITGWHQQHCNSLALAVRGAMNADNYQNRMSFDSAKVCTGFWSTFVDEEKQRVVKEKTEHDEAEKKASEEEQAEKDTEKKKEAEELAEKAAQQKKVAEAKAEESAAAAVVVEKKAEAEQAVKQTKTEVAAVKAPAPVTETSPAKAAEVSAPQPEPVKLAVAVPATPVVVEQQAAVSVAKPEVAAAEAKPAVAAPAAVQEAVKPVAATATK